VRIELSAQDLAALREVYVFADAALATYLQQGSRLTRDVISLSLGLAILDRMTEPDDEETR
jgi:hypothetical protein